MLSSIMYCLPSCQAERQAPGLLVSSPWRFEVLPWCYGPSSSVKKHVFSKAIKRINAIFCERIYPSTMSSGYFLLLLFFGILQFSFLYDFFFIFVNTGPYGMKIFKRHILKYTADSLRPKFTYTPSQNLN